MYSTVKNGHFMLTVKFKESESFVNFFNRLF